jgi:hypothetical protein
VAAFARPAWRGARAPAAGETDDDSRLYRIGVVPRLGRGKELFAKGDGAGKLPAFEGIQDGYSN